MFRNGRLRLLLTLSGLQLSGEDVPGARWLIPSFLTSKSLQETHNIIQKHCDNPADEIDGLDPHKLLRRKRVVDPTAPQPDATVNVDFGSDSEGEDNANLDELLFPPNPRSKSSALDELKKKRRKKRTPNDGEGDNELDDEILEARRLARQQNALERQRKIKSDLYVHASDEESDEDADNEFFQREEERRKAQAAHVREALITDFENKSKKSGKGQRKRKKTPMLLDSDDDADADDVNGSESDVIAGQRKRPRSETVTSKSGDEMDGIEETAPSPRRRSGAHTPPTSTEDDLLFGLGESPSFSFQRAAETGESSKTQTPKDSNMNDADDDDEPVAIRTRRPRVMAGFVVDSDSE